MPDSSSGLLLDTHVWIWLSTGDSALQKTTVDKIDKTRAYAHVFVPAISVWELCVLVSKGRLTINLPTLKWIEESLSQPGVEFVPLLPEIAHESTVLPGEFHGDPADRLIVATARIKRLPIVTRDSKILRYSMSGHVETIKA